MPEVAPAAVDAHQHVWDPARADYPWITPALDRLRRPFDHADVVAEQAEVGVGATVLVQAADNLDAEPVVGVRHLVHREADPDWLRPQVQDGLTVFGPHRLLYGGDWPFALLAADSYTQIWAGIRGCLDSLAARFPGTVQGGHPARKAASVRWIASSLAGDAPSDVGGAGLLLGQVRA